MSSVSSSSSEQNHGTTRKRKRVLIIGAGAAGMACADSLSLKPDLFDVTLVESAGYCGGQAFAIPVDRARFGTPWLNQGVQGGSHVYHHTLHFMKQQGFKAKPVKLSFSFGKGEMFWTNVYPTEFLEEHSHEIERFAKAIKTMKRWEMVWGIVPVKVSLKMFRLSEDFIERMVYPTLSLWFGTGNSTPDTPSAMLVRFYTNPDYGMWYPIDKKCLVTHRPEMLVFPSMTDFYTSWKHTLESRGVHVRLNTRVTSVVSRHKTRGVRVTIVKRRLKSDGLYIPSAYLPDGEDKDLADLEEEYDEVVFCVLADAAKRILGNQATWIEKKVLGAAKFSDDCTITHCDTAYMKKHYETEFTPESVVYKVGDRDETSRVEKATRRFNPMYYIKHDERCAAKVEMSFNCSQFQYQLKQENKPFRDQVFQTVFLNDKNENDWTKDEIDPRKMIRVDEFHQVRQGWKHYLQVVPFISLLQSHTRHTHFAGAWTVINCHEIAMISGLAAAYSLGAGYPRELVDDKWATDMFEDYVDLMYRKWGKSAKLRSREGLTTGKKSSSSSTPTVAVLHKVLAPVLGKSSNHSSSSTL